MEETSKPTKWWQWILIYPGLILGILGSYPTLVETYKSIDLKVPWGSVTSAETQNKLWIKNIDCQPTPFDWTTTVSDIAVDAKVCPSGDILISAKSFENENYFWVSINEIVNNSQASTGLFFNEAIAAPVFQSTTSTANETVICKRWVDNKKLLRRISTTDQGCLDEVVDTYTGRVISTENASCDASC